MSYASETWIYQKPVQNMTTYLNDGATEECCASHGWNMSPMRGCLTGPTQSPLSLMDYFRDDCFPWSPSKERWHHIQPDVWTTTWNQTQRKTNTTIITWGKDIGAQANISYQEALTTRRDWKTWRSVGNPRRTPDE